MSASRSPGIPIRATLVLLLASPSRLLLLFLLIANWNYLATFLDPAAQPLGLWVLGCIVLLAIASYLAMLGCLRLLRSGRRRLSISLALITFVILELPAVILLLLTPAALQLISCFSGGSCPGQPPPAYFPSAAENDALRQVISAAL